MKPGDLIFYYNYDDDIGDFARIVINEYTYITTDDGEKYPLQNDQGLLTDLFQPYGSE